MRLGYSSPGDAAHHFKSSLSRANVGHIGSCLCVVEILAAIYSV